jgi:transmembrane sensor
MEFKDTKEELATKYWLHYFRRNDVPELTAAELDQQSNQMYSALMQMAEVPTAKVRKLNLARLSAAAAILLVAGACLFYYKTSHKIAQSVPSQSISNVIMPGTTAATLILSDGKKIEISTVSAGKIADQTGVEIFKAAKNELVYKVRADRNKTGVSNTILTSNGEQYSVSLPDGTQVWLNAASSLKFPTTFASLATRSVELTGEAYFEVAKDASHPFIVKTAHQEVKVLGTHFNVNSYVSEKLTKTTLLEGSVKVVSKTNSSSMATLEPGQQSQLSSGGLKISEVDLSESMAWKNGDFNFDNEKFSSILNQISRWYNVDIIDNGKHDGLKLSGMVSRSKSLAIVLNSIEGTANVKFKIQGRKVIVIE